MLPVWVWKFTVNQDQASSCRNMWYLTVTQDQASSCRNMWYLTENQNEASSLPSSCPALKNNIKQAHAQRCGRLTENQKSSNSSKSKQIVPRNLPKSSAKTQHAKSSCCRHRRRRRRRGRHRQSSSRARLPKPGPMTYGEVRCRGGRSSEAEGGALLTQGYPRAVISNARPPDDASRRRGPGSRPRNGAAPKPHPPTDPRQRGPWKTECCPFFDGILASLVAFFCQHRAPRLAKRRLQSDLFDSCQICQICQRTHF